MARLNTTELRAVLKMENQTKKCSRPGCEFNKESQHLHVNVLYDELVNGAAASPEQIKTDVIFGILESLEKLFEEKNKKT